METRQSLVDMPRRDFLKAGASLTAFSAAGTLPTTSVLHAAESPAAHKSIGIQIGSVSFVDEGTEKVLDLLQERGAIDTIYLTTFTYGRGLAGRQLPGHPFPDHGVKQSDETFFHGGNYATPHPEFYRATVLKQTRAPDHGDLDILANVLPAAKKRGIRIFCSIEDVFRSDVPGVKEVVEVDLRGRKANTLCLCHPDVRAFWAGLAADLCKSYDIEGNNCGGERYANFIRNVGSTVFRDVPKGELLRFNNHLLNYGEEVPLEKLATTGLSPDYVFRETQRAIRGVGGKCKVLPGIDIGIPSGKNSHKASPDDTYAAVTAALKAGADGLILSRKYSEMKLANLAAAGRAVRDAAKR